MTSYDEGYYINLIQTHLHSIFSAGFLAGATLGSTFFLPQKHLHMHLKSENTMMRAMIAKKRHAPQNIAACGVPLILKY